MADLIIASHWLMWFHAHSDVDFFAELTHLSAAGQ